MSSRSDKSPVYRLYGVIVHLDVMNAAFSGHYVCYIRNNQNKWFKIDDSTVHYQIPLFYILVKCGGYHRLFSSVNLSTLFFIYTFAFNVPLNIISFTSSATSETFNHPSE